jgi:hypothetical protein
MGSTGRAATRRHGGARPAAPTAAPARGRGDGVPSGAACTARTRSRPIAGLRPDG